MPSQPMVLKFLHLVFLPCGICYWCSFCCCRRRLSKKEFNSDKVFYQVFCCCFRRRLPKNEDLWIKFTLRYLELAQLRGLFGYVGHYLQVVKAIGRESNLNFENEELLMRLSKSLRRERERLKADAIRRRSR